MLATGSGKTTIFCDIADRVVKSNGRVLIVAHRKELIRQCAVRVFIQTGITPSIEMAGEAASLDSDVVVASIGTLKGNRLTRFPHDHFSMIVIDEAHHAASDGYKRMIKHFGGAYLMGVTATPNRADKQNLADVFADVAFELNILDLTRMGFLSPIRVKSVPLTIDVSDVTMRGGDFSANELGDALTPYLRETAEVILRYAKGRKTLAFWPLVATSQSFKKVASEVGLRVAHIDASTGTGERGNATRLLDIGEVDVISNVGVMTEGVDIPCVDCVIIMRPTKSQSLFAQMVGRGTRLYTGKEDCLVLDPHFLHESHDLMEPANLIAADGKEGALVAKYLEEGETLDEAEEHAKADIAAAMIASLRAKAKRSPQTRTLIELSELFRNPEVLEFVPTMRWHSDPATQSQLAALEKMGVKGVSLKGHACVILGEAAKRREKGLATPKQVLWLRKIAYPEPEAVTFNDASIILDSHFKKYNNKKY